MRGTFDNINYALMRQLERLDAIEDVTTKEARAELERSKGITSTCLAMVENVNASINAMKAVQSATGRVVSIPKMLTDESDVSCG